MTDTEKAILEERSRCLNIVYDCGHEQENGEIWCRMKEVIRLIRDDKNNQQQP